MIDSAAQVNEQTQKRAIIRACKTRLFMPDIAIHPKLLVMLCGFITDLHLACVTSKNCWQQEALPSVTKLSEIGVINSGKGIVVKSGRTGGN